MYLGHGDGTFLNPVEIPTADVGGVAIGDVDNDDIIDIVLTNTFFHQTCVYLGNGDGSFEEGPTIATFTSPDRLLMDDFNQDGFNDLAIAELFDDILNIFLGDGEGNFEFSGSYQTHEFPRSMTLGDFNSDSFIDIAIANRDSRDVSVYLGFGDGSFAEPFHFTNVEERRNIVTSDFNSNGSLDLVVASDYRISVFLNQSAETLVASSMLIVRGNLQSGTLEDTFASDDSYLTFVPALHSTVVKPPSGCVSNRHFPRQRRPFI